MKKPSSIAAALPMSQCGLEFPGRTARYRRVFRCAGHWLVGSCDLVAVLCLSVQVLPRRRGRSWVPGAEPLNTLLRAGARIGIFVDESDLLGPGRPAWGLEIAPVGAAGYRWHESHQAGRS